jgi:hypothetical protein
LAAIAGVGQRSSRRPHAGLAGGSAGAELWQANIDQVQGRLVSDETLTVSEVERFRRLTRDPAFSVNSYLLVSGWGQRTPA